MLALAARADQKTRTLDLYWIDSEGGGSTLVVTPAGEAVLIDSGNPGGIDSSRIVRVLRDAGLARLDYFLLTHFHVDHFGGIAEVAQQIPVRVIYQRAMPEGDPDGRAVSTFPVQSRSYREMSAPRELLKPGVAIPLKAVQGQPPLTLRCLAAGRQFMDPRELQAPANPVAGPAKERTPNDNDNSAVFVLTFGPWRFFDGGDLTWNEEARLVSPFNLVGSIDVFQTDHHGLDSSNNPVLLRALAPSVVVMNNGPHKGGQPGAFETIRSLPGLKALYQVHKSFEAPLAANAPDEFIANHDDLGGADAAKCPANVIKLSVSSDAGRYTISIPSNGYARTYATKVN